MINRFLKAKHWQLFLLLFAIPMVVQVSLMIVIIGQGISKANPLPTVLLPYLKYFPALMIIFWSIFLGWFWSIAIGLQEKIPSHINMKIKQFKIFFFIPIIYFSSLVLLFTSVLSSDLKSFEIVNTSFFGAYIMFFFMLHLFSMFRVFYSLFFVVKTIKTAELKRETTFGDFTGDFFLLWFFPVGIWKIQPRINKLIEEDSFNTNDVNIFRIKRNS